MTHRIKERLCKASTHLSFLNYFLTHNYFEISTQFYDHRIIRKAVTHKLRPFLLIGLMADMLGSYTVTFYTAGAILMLGASITTLMAFVKQQPEEDEETTSYDEKLLVSEKVTVV